MRIKLLFWIIVIFIIVSVMPLLSSALKESYGEEVITDDTNLDASTPSTPQGAATTIQWRRDSAGFSEAMFIINITNVTQKGNIEILEMYIDWNIIFNSAGGEDVLFNAFLRNWTEGNADWDHRVCGTVEDSFASYDTYLPTHCNLTAFLNTTTTGTGKKTYNITSAGRWAIQEGLDNVSFSVRMSDPSTGNLVRRINSKEAGSNNYIVNISYRFITVPSPTAFTITAKDLYDNAGINNITVIISNSSFSFNASTQNGTILISNSSFKFNESYDIKFLSNESGGYFNITFNSVFISTIKIIQGTLFQSILRVNATEVITGNQITSFTVSVPLQSNISNSSGFSTLHLRAGDYNINLVAVGFITGHTNISVSNLEDRTLTMILGTSNLTITASSSEGTVNDFNTTMTLLTTPFNETKETNNGKVVFSTIAGTYNITLNASGFAFAHETIIIAAGNRFPNITFNLFSENSINITIFDEETNEIINYTTVTLILDHIIQQFTNTTNTGNSFFIGLFDGLWNLLASTSQHTQRGYIFTIVPQSTSSLNVYLLNSSNGEVKTLTVKNKQDQSLPGSTISISNRINNTFVTVAQRVTDFAGQANIFLSSSNNYRFTIEAPGFTTKVFDLTPVASAYDIIMDSLDTIDFTTIFNDVTFTILPASNIITPTDSQNISIITSSPDGRITYFGLNSSFNNTDRLTNVSGSPAGGTASISINTSAFNSTAIDVNFFIKISGEPIITIHQVFRTAASTTPAGNASAVSIADKYKDSFTDVGKALIIVIAAVAIILSLAEVGAPAVMHGAAGALVIIFGVIIRWIPIPIGIIVGFVLISMYVVRGFKE